MDGQGWLKLNRKLLDWEWYRETNTKALFIHMLLRANYDDQCFKGVPVPRGCFVSSYPHLAEETGLSVQTVRTSVKRLISTGEITVKKYPKFTLYKVEKYSRYQEDNRASNSQLTGFQQASNSQLTPIKEIKNVRNKEIKNTVGASPSSEVVISLPLSSGSYPIDQNEFEYWQDLYPTINVLQEMKKMIGWLDAHPDKKKDKGNIKAFVSRWLSKAQDQATKEASSSKEATSTGLPDWYSYRPHSPQSEATKRELKKRMERIKNK